MPNPFQKYRIFRKVKGTPRQNQYRKDITICLDASMFEAVRDIVFKQGISFSAKVRQYIKEGLEREPKED